MNEKELYLLKHKEVRCKACRKVLVTADGNVLFAAHSWKWAEYLPTSLPMPPLPPMEHDELFYLCDEHHPLQ